MEGSLFLSGEPSIFPNSSIEKIGPHSPCFFNVILHKFLSVSQQLEIYLYGSNRVGFKKVSPMTKGPF